jgi:hypothetical protein
MLNISLFMRAHKKLHDGNSQMMFLTRDVNLFVSDEFCLSVFARISRVAAVHFRSIKQEDLGMRT